jgi:S-DNA-T family DNA segregation ATPase FtsK/SpoIIIE
MDPDVAEMVSTASIVRTAPEEVSDGAPAKTPRRKHGLPFGPAYELPSLELLETPIGHCEQAEEELRERATILAEKCKEFAVTGHIHRINPGPVVTTFEFKPDPGIKYSRVVGLAEDLCLALKAESIRIDRIPGKSTVGIEVPNAQRETIRLREVIESARFQQTPSKLAIALGKTINGEVYVADLVKMPHLLIAGATGAGKSVTLNAIICSILYKASPADVKFIMVDPKRLELGLYEGIPHLLTPIVTDPKRAANALRWAVNEMESRYKTLAALGVRNIDQYNRQVREMMHPTLWDDYSNPMRPLPFIVIAIDELADLMMIARADVETSIARLAQMARAVGIHLVLATQRPSVDVITGIIKANFPSRIAVRVSSKVDSRTIIDSNGAEALLGQGDMLFLPPASSRLIRVHGSFVNEQEIKRITDHARKQAEPDYNEMVTMSEDESDNGEGFTGERDELYDEALAIVTDMGRASTSVLQRRLSIGYGRAAKILDAMEREGFIGPVEGAKPRKVLPAAYEFRGRLEERLDEDE